MTNNIIEKNIPGCKDSKSLVNYGIFVPFSNLDKITKDIFMLKLQDKLMEQNDELCIDPRF